MLEGAGLDSEGEVVSRGEEQPLALRQESRNSRPPALSRNVLVTASIVELSCRINSWTDELAKDGVTLGGREEILHVLCHRSQPEVVLARRRAIDARKRAPSSCWISDHASSMSSIRGLRLRRTSRQMWSAIR
jgi:hypothetical protein